MNKKFISIILSLALAVLPGCNSISPATQKVIARTAISIAVNRVAANNPEKAQRVAKIARELRAVAGDEGANTVSLLTAMARAKVQALNLSNEDLILANGLIDVIGEELKARLGEGVLSNDKLLIVGEVAGWIIDAAASIPPAQV